MKNYLINLACRGAGLGPWTGIQSVGHIRAGRGPSLIHTLRAADSMAGPFETEAPSLAGSEMPGELGDGPDGWMARPDTGSIATPLDSVTPWSPIEEHMEIPDRVEVPRPRDEAIDVSGPQARLQPREPAVTGQQDMELHTEVPSLETRQTRRTSQEQGPDSVVTSEKPKKQDTTGDGPYPVKPPCPVVAPTIMFEKTANRRKGGTLQGARPHVEVDAPHFIERSIPSSGPAGGVENVFPHQDPLAYSTPKRIERPTMGDAQTSRVQKNEASRPRETGMQYIRKVSEHHPPGTLEKTISLIRPSADSLSSLVAAAISGPQSTGPGERGRVTRPQQSVTVRIGRVEVRAVHEAGKTPLPRPPGSTPPQSGFDEYLSLRNYTYSEP